MDLRELNGCKVMSIHYPNWDEYFERYYSVEDAGSDYTIGTIYAIRKEEIACLKKQDNIITIVMNDRRVITLCLDNHSEAVRP